MFLFQFLQMTKQIHWDGFGQIGPEVLEDGLGGFQHLDPTFFHLPVVLAKLENCMEDQYIYFIQSSLWEKIEGYLAKGFVGRLLGLPDPNVAEDVPDLPAEKEEVEGAPEDSPRVLHQSLVHLLGPFKLLQFLDERVVAEDGPGQTQGVGRRARHVLDNLVLELLQDQVQVFAAFRVGVKLVVVDCHFPFGGLSFKRVISFTSQGKKCSLWTTPALPVITTAEALQILKDG